MATAFPSAPTPYSITPEQWVALSNLNLNPGGTTGNAGTMPVSSYGLTQGTPAVQNTPQASTQTALQQALSNALNNTGGLSSFVQSLLSNPTAAQAAAGSASTPYTPTQPSNAWRLSFQNGGSGNGPNQPLFG